MDHEEITYKFKPSLELEKIDCNCNNCVFMDRDLDLYKKWHDWHYEMELEDFTRRKKKATEDAQAVPGLREREGMLRVANKMKFQFEKIFLINYGNCTKFNKPVSFIPNHCQIETQKCFVHRREVAKELQGI